MNSLNSQEAGVDIVRIDRFRKHVENPQFLNRVFNPSEIKAILSHKKPEIRMAGRWAAKEAVSKAFGCGIGEKLGFKDITITNNSNGKPIVEVDETVNAAFGFPKISLSISHDGDYAIAFVVVHFPS